MAAPTTLRVLLNTALPVTAIVFANVAAPLIVNVPGELTEAIENVALTEPLPTTIDDAFATKLLTVPVPGAPIVYDVALTSPGEYTPELLPTTPPTDSAIVFSTDVPIVRLVGLRVAVLVALVTEKRTGD